MDYEPWLIFLGALLGTAVVLGGAKWLLDRHEGAAPGRRFSAQMTMLVLSLGYDVPRRQVQELLEAAGGTRGSPSPSR